MEKLQLVGFSHVTHTYQSLPDLFSYFMIGGYIFFHLVNVGEDCPVFDGLFEFCQLSTGGSIGMSPLLS